LVEIILNKLMFYRQLKHLQSIFVGLLFFCCFYQTYAISNQISTIPIENGSVDNCVPILIPNLSHVVHNFRNSNVSLYELFNNLTDIEYSNICLYKKESHVIKEDTFYFKDFLFNYSHAIFDIPEDLLESHNILTDISLENSTNSTLFKSTFHYRDKIVDSLQNLKNIYAHTIGANKSPFKKSKNAFHHFKSHINKPITFLGEQFSDEDKLVELKTIGSEFYKKLTQRISNIYKGLKKRNIIERVNIKNSREMNQYVNRYKSFNHLLHSKNSEFHKWKTYEDPSNIIYTNSLSDMYYYMYSKLSYLFHINNEFNQSGLYTRASPYTPLYNAISKKPVFIGPTYSSFYPAGFDPNNPQCGDLFSGYNNPFYYFKSLLYIFTYFTGVAEYIHSDPFGYLSFFFSWTVYEYRDYPLHLPPNMIPCISIGFFPFLSLITILFSILTCSGIISSIWLDIRKSLKLSDVAHRDIPILATKIPKSIEALDNLDFGKIIPEKSSAPTPKKTEPTNQSGNGTLNKRLKKK
jgi:hypothetical protein